ncbi:MAG: 3-isopropylmalate dehydratase small subunit [Pseudomonadales bacterium]|nr:3-isopropylmalate dehydratase small subunit [Pseudomonadales bacterium]
MKAFSKMTGRVAPLDRANVDTDQIIPKQFLKSIKRTGFGDNLFDAWRFLDEGSMEKSPNERQINFNFVLNQERYQGTSILLTRSNFGCGSSREHAVWALLEYGFECVIAPSFADIFYNNCFKNGLLPIVLEEKYIEEMFTEMKRIESLGDGQVYSLMVDLPGQCVTKPDGSPISFEIKPDNKTTMLEGLDEIGTTLRMQPAIKAFEKRHKAAQPWLFS